MCLSHSGARNDFVTYWEHLGVFPFSVEKNPASDGVPGKMLINLNGMQFENNE